MRLAQLGKAAIVVATALTFAATAKAADIVDTAAAAGNFKTLLTAAKAAGLVDTLKGEGPITVFAPTDEAFAGLGQDTLNELLKPENKEKLRKILAYHCVPGSYMKTNVDAEQNWLETMSGQAIYVQAVSDPGADEIYVANHDYTNRTKFAQVVQVDIMADNGVIHAIDKVILPPDMD